MRTIKFKSNITLHFQINEREQILYIAEQSDIIRGN